MVSTKSSLIMSVTSTDEFQEHVINSPVPTLVDLWAPWCGPCRAQMPILETVAAKAGDKARVVKVNVDDAVEIAQSLGVRSIPTLIVFTDGKETARFVGVQSEAELTLALGLKI